MFAGLTIVALLASSALAAPYASAHHHLHRDHHKKKRADTFNIAVTNNCAVSRSIGLFQITSAFEMLSMSTPVTLASGDNTTVAAPYTEIGMRLSGTADQGTAYQWEAQALFEFGYSAFSSVEGTAYDLSLMEGSDPDIGISVVPSNSNCESKTCTPSDCPASQGWTNADQDEEGSPADTTCYYGVTDFAVTFCPST